MRVPVSNRITIPQLQNLLAYSNDATQTGTWLLSGFSSAVANTTDTLDPFGGNNAFTILENSGTGAHWARNSSSSVFIAGRQYTVSNFAKAGSEPYTMFSPEGSGAFSAFFNLSNGTVGNITRMTNVTIVPYGNGWYRCSASYISSGSTPNQYYYSSPSNGTISYVGTPGNKPTYYYDCQTILGNWPGPVCLTTSSPINTGSLRNIVMNRVPVSGRSQIPWDPSQLAGLKFLWDTSVASTITQSSNNVSQLADARGSGFTEAVTGVGAAQPVMNTGITLAGRIALVFTNANSSKMASADTGALPAGAPWYIFMVAQFLTSPTYGMLATIGGPQPSTPENGFLGTANNHLWPAYINVTQTGYGFSQGRETLDLTAPHAYLAAFDGVSLRCWIDGRQQTQIDNTTLTILSKQLTLGGEFFTGFGQCPNFNGFYGFFGYNYGLIESDVANIFAYSQKNLGITPLRLTVNHGCSIEAGANLSGGKTAAWPQLAANQATIVPNVNSYAVFGLGVGWVTGQNTWADSSVNGNGTWALGNPTGTVASPGHASVGEWSSIWDIEPAGSPNKYTLYWGSTIATNDLYYSATASQAYFSQQIVAAFVLSRGGLFVPCTVFPRNGTGTPAGFETQRQAYNALVLANWNGPLKAVRILNATNASPIVITTTNPHTFNTGDQVNIELLFGNGAANNAQGSPWTVTVIDSTHFSLNGSSGSGAWTGGGVAFSGTGLGAQYWMDPGNLTQFSVTTNTTYFQGDQTHPTATGQNVIATVAGPGSGAMSPLQILNALG